MEKKEPRSERGAFVLRQERGAALGMVVLVAVCFSIAAFTALVLALSRVRQKDFYKRRAIAQYAAEASLVWAMQQLWVDDAYCGGSGPTVSGLTPTITVTSCIPGSSRTIQSTVAGF